jgi:hypothetical protein
MHRFQRRTGYRTALLTACIAVLILGGCPKTTNHLRDVQDDFNRVNPTFFQAADPNTLTADEESAYRQIVQKIETEQLKSVERDDLKVVAYAIDAFSKWRLRDYAAAKATAEKGLDVFARAGLQTNWRDYGLLLITGGLADYSETFWDYQNWLRDHPNDFLPVNDATAYTDRMAAAMKKIDAVNQPEKGLASDVPIVLYANQQQLRVITGILDIWSNVRDDADQKSPVCHWTEQAEMLVSKRFPSTTDYPSKAQTDELEQKISAVGQSYQCGG